MSMTVLAWSRRVFRLALPIAMSAALAGLMAFGAAAPAKKPVKRSSTSSKKSTKKSSKRKPVKSWRTGQQKPAPERHREIQQALIDRGYLPGSATGDWGPSSVEALKKFQLDQNLKGSGKLDSLSLIALGLGPKRTANTQPRAQP